MTNMLPKLQSFCLALLLTIAAGIGCGFLTAGLFSAYYELRSDQVGPRYADYGERVRVLADGTPVIERQEYWGGRTVYLDADRNELDVRESLLPDRGNPNQKIARSLEPAALGRPRPVTGVNRIFRGRWAPDQLHLARVRGREDWYMLRGDAPDDRMYLVGYDRYRRRVVGYFGADGYQEEPVPVDRQFAIDPHTFGWGGGWYVQQSGAARLCLLNGREAVYLDLEARTIDRPFGAADVLSLSGMQVVQVIRSEEASVTSVLWELIAVRSEDGVRVYDWTGRLTGVYAIPPDWESQNGLEFYLTEDGDAVFCASDTPPVDHDDYQEYFVTCVRTTQTGEASVTTVAARRPSFYLREPVVPQSVEVNFAAAGVAAPLAGVAVAWLTYVAHDEAAGLGVPDPPVVADLWPALVFVFSVGAVCVVLAERRRRAYGLPRELFWLGCVFVFGLPGYVGYVCHRRWPVREPAAAPRATGCEIFDRPRLAGAV